MEVERLINNCICKPRILKFVSEYELIHGSSPIQEGNIVACGSKDAIFKTAKADIEKFYDAKPIILVADPTDTDACELLLKDLKVQYFLGTSTQVLD